MVSQVRFGTSSSSSSSAWPSLKHCRTVVNYVQGDREVHTRCRLKEGSKLSVHS